MKQNYKSQLGFGAFGYILMSVVLLAALTSALSLMSRNSNRAQANDILVAKIYGQASKIRADIQLCITERTTTSGVGPASYQQFPTCNGTAPGSGGNSTKGYTDPYYCANVSSNSDILANARALRCKSPSQTSVWDNAEGNFFPEKITGFEEWKYYISTSDPSKGVSLMITSENRASSADTDWVLRKVASRFGANEARVLNRAVGGDDTGGAISPTTACPGGLCNTLQIWLAGSN